MLALTEYDWPGNVRELENTIERAVVLARGRAIEVEDLMSHGISMGIPALAWAGGNSSRWPTSKRTISKPSSAIRTEIKSRTAAILGIDRKTLWAKIKKYGLEGKDEFMTTTPGQKFW